MRVDRGALRVRLAEHVVEDLQRQRPAVPGGQHVARKAGRSNAPWPGKEPVVPAPLEHVHVHRRRIGELEEEQLVARNVGDPGRVRPTGQDVEAVDAQPERRMVGAAHDLPRPVVGVDESAPGQRLVGHPHAALGGAVGEQVQLLGDAVVVVDGVG